MKWRLYWLALITALFGAVMWKNYKMYTDQSRRFKVAKSIMETCLLALASAFVPPLLIAYGSAWATKPLETRPYIRMGAGIILSIILMMLGGWILELLALIGVFAIELLSADFLKYYQERKDKRLLTAKSDVVA